MTFVKHSILLTILFIALPLLTRILINRINRRAGLAGVPIDLPFLIQTVGLGIIFPLAANGTWELLTMTPINPVVARYISLAVVGGLYGSFYALQSYVYRWPAVILGIVGGLLAALLYSVLPFTSLTLALCAMALTVLPVLAVEFPLGPLGRIIQAGQTLLPLRGYLR